MFLTDSHVHFDDYVESGEIEDVLARAADANVCRMLAVGGRASANLLAVRLASEYAGRIYAVVGYDRDEACAEAELESLRPLLDMSTVVAVGEIGLDYHYSRETADEQKALFQRMLELASSSGCPVVVHSREAEDDTIALLEKHVAGLADTACAPGVLHCFTGSEGFARKLLDIGMMISFSGIITFKNAAVLRKVAEIVPDDHLLVETDAPLLAPEPNRGKRNEPAYVVRVAEALAQIRGCDVAHIADITTRNTARLFQLREP